MSELPRYDRTNTYQWNFDHAPRPVEVDVPVVPGEWNFLGLPVGSPLGVPAGPLLNGQWCLYYASLGFDVLTYKTVRSVERECYPLPNLLPVDSGQLNGDEINLLASESMQGSWAVAFGMPSKQPDYWRKDIETTRAKLPSSKVLNVSVVGSVQEGWTLDQLAQDYAQCARWAVESGADTIETNFSCPNVDTCDGQLYQVPNDARLVTEAVRSAIGDTPFIVKVGHVNSSQQCAELIENLAPSVTALAMTNSVAVTVADHDGNLFFEGQRRGICGDSIRRASLAQVQLFAEQISQKNLDLQLIGVGGASRAEHVQDYLAAGASAVHLATAAMVDPHVALDIRHRFMLP